MLAVAASAFNDAAPVEAQGGSIIGSLTDMVCFPGSSQASQ